MKKIYQGDCLDILNQIESDSLDSMITDPPAGISFMGKAWDDDKGGRKQWIAWMTEVMQECLRVLKPGAHGLVWAIPRTSHWTATALEDAGFEVRDVVTHIFGSGFPKSMDISKAIDKAAGAERVVLGPDLGQAGRKKNKGQVAGMQGTYAEQTEERVAFLTAPSTPEAKQWQGWGTALKPASEHWILVRKPISAKTVAANVLEHGTGGINIDASRIGIDPNDINHRKPSVDWQSANNPTVTNFGSGGRPIPNLNIQGRFPANLVFSHNPDCVEVGTKKVKAIKGGNSTNVGNQVYGKYDAELDKKSCGFGDADGTETVSAFECSEGCAVAALDKQSGVTTRKDLRTECSTNLHWNSAEQLKSSRVQDQGGGASRFFKCFSGEGSRFLYCAKASKKDKNNGLENSTEKRRSSDARPNSGDYTGKFPDHDHREKTGNFHPTVKSTTLMSYLIKLITPPNGTVLDPFMGSGSTGVAAKREGFIFLGIEKDPEYFNISENRLNS